MNSATGMSLRIYAWRKNNEEEKKTEMSSFILNTNQWPNTKSLNGGWSRLWQRVKVDSGIGLPLPNAQGKCAVAEFIDPDWGNMPELTWSPSHGFMNSATGVDSGVASTGSSFDNVFVGGGVSPSHAPFLQLTRVLQMLKGPEWKWYHAL
jgi:hypothetical protein